MHIAAVGLGCCLGAFDSSQPLRCQFFLSETAGVIQACEGQPRTGGDYILGHRDYVETRPTRLELHPEPPVHISWPMARKSSLMKRLFSAAFQRRSYSAPADRSIPAAKRKYVPTSGTYPKGFLAGTSHAGVKASNRTSDDIALVVSEQRCPAAAVFTRNVFKAAPVNVSRAILRQRNDRGFRGVVVNSGCANAVTGPLGSRHAVEMAATADKCFDPDSIQPPADGDWEDAPRTLVMSTGVIGQKLPIEKIVDAIPKAHAALGSTHEHWMKAARAICTTDTFPKLLSRTFTLPSHPATEYRIAGMAKGAGMIHPNMGTLLGIICTDAKIAPADMKRLLSIATNRSFNCISIDGDTSTNDTVAFFANGAAAPADAKPLSYPASPTSAAALTPPRSEDETTFFRILTEFMTDLAKLCVRDGEGATKFVTIRVQSTESIQAARRAASSIATSALVKTALYGKDANWGRILCAIGYAPGIMENPALRIRSGSKRQVDPFQTSVSFIPSDGSEELRLLALGEPQEVDEARAKQILEMEDLEISVKLDDVDGLVRNSEGRKTRYDATYWTCDFSHEYVTINGDYRT